MMLKTDKLLEKYILDHIDDEDLLLTELFRQTQLKMVNGRMCSGHLQGTILSMLSSLIAPKQILEIGTYTGYSALCLAKGLSPDGMLHTLEINDELEAFARQFFERSPYGNQIVQHIGDALQLIGQFSQTFDLIFIDADKREYARYYELVLPKLRQGGLIIADNTLWDGKVVKAIDPKDEQTVAISAFNQMVKLDNRVETTLLPVRDGMTLLRKK